MEEFLGAAAIGRDSPFWSYGKNLKNIIISAKKQFIPRRLVRSRVQGSCFGYTEYYLTVLEK